MTKLRIFAVLLSAATLVACDKNAVQDITGPVAASRVKFFNFGVSAPGVHFYANDTKMAAISSTSGIESTSGTAYGGASSGGFYSAIAPGSIKLSGKIAATIDKDLIISAVTTTIESGKSYSFYMSGLYDAAAKSVEAFVVEDPYPAAIDYTQAYVRFVNAVSNSSPMTLYAKNTVTLAEVPVGAIIAYKGGGAFVAVPSGVYDLGARESGVATNKMSRLAVSFSAGRVYTIAARGNITVTSTQALDNTTNR